MQTWPKNGKPWTVQALWQEAQSRLDISDVTRAPVSSNRLSATCISRPVSDSFCPARGFRMRWKSPIPLSQRDAECFIFVQSYISQPFLGRCQELNLSLILYTLEARFSSHYNRSDSFLLCTISQWVNICTLSRFLDALWISSH